MLKRLLLAFPLGLLACGSDEPTQTPAWDAGVASSRDMAITPKLDLALADARDELDCGAGNPLGCSPEGDAAVAPDRDAAPNRDAAPERDAAPDQDAAPEQDAAPDRDAAPDQDTTPEQDAAGPRADANAPGPPSPLDLGNGVTITPGDPRPGAPLEIFYAGALADAPRVGVHYGFNGWNEVADYELTAQEDDTSNVDFFAEAWMRPVEGGHVLEIHAPEGARALHFVFFAGEEDRDWDNNDRRDYELGLGAALMGPILTFEGVDPATHVRVTAHTGAPCDGLVEFGDTPALGSTRATQDQRGHHLEIPRLQPLFYRFSCGGRVLSEVIEARPPPRPGAPLRFGVIGDAQARGERLLWPDVAAALQAAEVDLVLATGDLAWDDHPGLWWAFFDEARGLLSSTPMLATVGNHDTPTTGTHEDTSSFERWFGIEVTYRAFEVGDAAFILLDTENRPDLDVGMPQYAWLDDAAGRIEAPWAFVGMHHPPYNLGLRHYSQQGEVRELTQLLDGRIDWVFTGHEHMYQRLKPMRYNGQIVARHGRGLEEGVGYLIVPPAGAWPAEEIVGVDHERAHYRDRIAHPTLEGDQARLFSENGYVIVTLDAAAGRLDIEAFMLGHPERGFHPPERVDAFQIQR